MDKRYQDTGAAGCHWGAGQEQGGRAEDGSPSPDALRCGTLVLTGFPVPQPKDRPAPPPAAPGKGAVAASD